MLSLYNTYPEPSYSTSIGHILDILQKRISILKAVERLIAADPTISIVKWHAEIEKQYFKDAFDDSLSHLLLRLAVSSDIDASNWFVKMESILLENKFINTTPNDQTAFLNQCGSFHLVNGTHYQVPFEFVPSLVGHRQVILDRGSASVPLKDTSVLVKEVFRSHLEAQVAVASNAQSHFMNDSRMARVLKMYKSCHLDGDSGQPDFSSGVEVNVADDIKRLSYLYPPCMATLQDHMNKHNHLRHGGRMQYGLFIKGLGLPIQEAIIFWRKMFKNISDDEFAKKYKYNIRHNYGLEGKRSNYQPYKSPILM